MVVDNTPIIPHIEVNSFLNGDDCISALRDDKIKMKQEKKKLKNNLKNSNPEWILDMIPAVKFILSYKI